MSFAHPTNGNDREDNNIMRITVPLDDDLLREAQWLTGLTDLNDLIEAGLQALIARERARRLEEQQAISVELQPGGQGPDQLPRLRQPPKKRV